MATRPDDADDSGPGEPQDDEERWLEIVARLGDLGSDSPDKDPTSGAAHDGTSGAAIGGGRGASGPARGPAEPAPPPAPVDPTAIGPGPRTVRPAQDPRSWAPDPVLEEAETHFVPPDPGPVLGGDPLLTMAWGAAIGAPMLLLVAAVVWRDIPTIVLQAAGVAFFAAVGLLLWRMPHQRDEDDGPGAVV